MFILKIIKGDPMSLNALIDNLVALGFMGDDYLRLGLADGRYILVSDLAGERMPMADQDGLCAVLWSSGREVLEEVEIRNGSFDDLFSKVQAWAIGSI